MTEVFVEQPLALSGSANHINGVAPLIADLSGCNSTNRQTPPIDTTLEPMMRFEILNILNLCSKVYFMNWYNFFSSNIWACGHCNVREEGDDLITESLNDDTVCKSAPGFTKVCFILHCLFCMSYIQ